MTNPRESSDALRYGTLDVLEALERLGNGAVDVHHENRPRLAVQRVTALDVQVVAEVGDQRRIFTLQITDIVDEQWEYGVEHPEVITTAHSSRGAAEFTLSKLPGGTLVRRLPGRPWEPAPAAAPAVDAVPH